MFINQYSFNHDKLLAVSKFILFLFIFSAIVISFVKPPTVSAHFPATDGDIIVTLHIDPDDNPTPGEQANIYFLFDDSAKRFKLSQCQCVVTISEQGKRLTQQNIYEKKYTHPSIWGTNMPYVFPSRDVYHIQIAGSPESGGTFQPFTVSWDFRVDPDDSPGIVVQPYSDLPFLLGTLAAIIVFVAFMGWFVKTQLIDYEEKVDSTGKKHYNK